MNKFHITGMSCAACSSRVEKAVSALNGVKDCSVNLLTNSMTVEGDASPETIIAAVESAGYGAALDAPKRKFLQKKQAVLIKLKKPLLPGWFPLFSFSCF